MNPRILYGLAKATPPEGDAYVLPGLRAALLDVSDIRFKDDAMN
jgi:hypothetical protein